MKIKEVSLSSIAQDPNNVRRHPTKNLAAIKGSLAKFGQQKPIVIDDRGIILAGNGTYAAALELGWDTIKVVVTDIKESFLKTAFALADNRTAELAEWDLDGLDVQLGLLKAEDFNIGDIGFNDDPSKWASDFEDVKDTEENLDPIKATIKIEIDQAEKDGFKEWLSSMISQSDYEAKIV